MFALFCVFLCVTVAFGKDLNVTGDDNEYAPVSMLLYNICQGKTIKCLASLVRLDMFVSAAHCLSGNVSLSDENRILLRVIPSPCSKPKASSDPYVVEVKKHVNYRNESKDRYIYDVAVGYLDPPFQADGYYKTATLPGLFSFPKNWKDVVNNRLKCVAHAWNKDRKIMLKDMAMKKKKKNQYPTWFSLVRYIDVKPADECNWPEHCMMPTLDYQIFHDYEVGAPLLCGKLLFGFYQGDGYTFVLFDKKTRFFEIEISGGKKNSRNIKKRAHHNTSSSNMYAALTSVMIGSLFNALHYFLLNSQ